MPGNDPSITMNIRVENDCSAILNILRPDNDTSIDCHCDGDVLKIIIPSIKYNSIFNVCNEILGQIEMFEKIRKIE
jgi:hypothetical protein